VPLGRWTFLMKVISDICGWVAVVCFPTAVVSGLLLVFDWIRRAKLPGLRKLLLLVALLGISLMGLGGIVIFSEIAKHQPNEPKAFAEIRQ